MVPNREEVKLDEFDEEGNEEDAGNEESLEEEQTFSQRSRGLDSEEGCLNAKNDLKKLRQM